MSQVADDMRKSDLRCFNFKCPQWIQGECGAPDPEVCAGNDEKGLMPCPDRLLPKGKV